MAGARMEMVLMMLKRIRERREALGMTRKDLAALLNVSPKAVGHWETGRREPDLKMLQSIARVLHTSMSYLLGETDDPSPIITAGQAAHSTESSHDVAAELHPEDMADIEAAILRVLKRIKEREST